MKTTNLSELRELRDTIKAAEARINEISDQATAEAVAILAAQGRDRGEFTEDGHTFQLQRTEGYDFADYHRYREQEAVQWRAELAKKSKAQQLVKAHTALMNGFIKTFLLNNPDKQPDEIKPTVKCLD